MYLPTIIKRIDCNWAGGSDDVEIFIFENEIIRDETFKNHKQEIFMENFEKTNDEIKYYTGDYKITFEKSEIKINNEPILLI